MAAQNVHQKSQMSVYTCTRHQQSQTWILESLGLQFWKERYACVLRIIGFTHYIRLPIGITKHSQRFVLILLVPCKHCSQFLWQKSEVTQLASSGSGILEYSNQDIYLVCSPLPGQSIEDPRPIRWLTHRVISFRAKFLCHVAVSLNYSVRQLASHKADDPSESVTVTEVIVLMTQSLKWILFCFGNKSLSLYHIQKGVIFIEII